MALKPAVADAISQLQRAFGVDHVSAHHDEQGGAWIELTGVPLEGPYLQSETWLIAHLPFNLPGADVYPIFVRPDLQRRDGGGHGTGFSVTQLNHPNGTRAALQLSRRTLGDFAAQSPLQKIEKVLEWLVKQ